MHYLTNYYKNLCEQLQEKLNILEAELGRVQANTKREREDLEAAAMNPSYSSTPDPKSDLIRVTTKPKIIDKKIDGGPKIRPKPRPASENPRLKKENPKPVNEAMSEQEALGMPVPILKSGKGGNYEEWRAAKDARNAALRKARMGGDREKVIGKLVRPEDLDKEAGTIDPKIPSDIFKPDYVLPGREPRPGDAGMIRPDSKPTPRDPSKPLPYIYPQREPRPGDRGPIPFNPDRKPLFPGMNPNPFIKPGLKPANPSKIPSDMFRPGKRTPKIPTGGLLPAPERIDYDLERKLPKYYTGSLPKLGDSNLIGKIPTEQEAYGGKLMSTMQQSQVDLEGNPTGLVKNIPVKPKIDPRYKR